MKSFDINFPEKELMYLDEDELLAIGITRVEYSYTEITSCDSLNIDYVPESVSYFKDDELVATILVH